MSFFSRVCEPCCQCVGDYCNVPKYVLHIISTVIWISGIIAVDAKLILYCDTVSKGVSSDYDIVCLPNSEDHNRWWIPFLIGATLGLLQVYPIYKWVRRNYTRIHELPDNDGYLISQSKSCYECYFLAFLGTILFTFVILDEQLCGSDLHTENVEGSKCVFIGLDACVGLFLTFGFSGFIVSWIKGPLPARYEGLLTEDQDVTSPQPDEPNTVI